MEENLINNMRQLITVEKFLDYFCISKDELFNECKVLLEEGDFQYEKLSFEERDNLLLAIIKRINSDEMWISGKDKKIIWEKGWDANLKQYDNEKKISALVPKFLQAKKIFRLNGEYIKASNENFEFDLIDVFRTWVFKKYFTDSNEIFEFGCGSCQHLLFLADLFPNKMLHGLDWAKASSEIINKLVKEKGWNLKGYIFDMFSPDYNVKFGEKSVVFTVGAMEQLGDNFKPFVDFLLEKKPSIIVHMETIEELYDKETLTDNLALMYDKKRNYLKGYLTYLQQLETEEKLSFINVQHVLFGSMFHDSYSLLVWRPN